MDAADGTREVDVEFWRRHALVGLSISAATIATALVYLGMSPEGPNRTLLMGVLVVSGLLTGGIAALPLRAIMRHPLRPWFFGGWSTSIVALLAFGVYYDGGLESPFAAMLFLPLVYAAMAYPPLGTAGVAGQVVTLHVVFALADRVVSGRELAMLVALLMTAGMCALTAKLHWRAMYDQVDLAQRLATLADQDGLTGCLNHRAFHERLQGELARAQREGTHTAVILCDLDGFKAVNDLQGHPEGDALLRLVGAALRDGARPSDVVGRLGGDELAVLLPGTGLLDALEVGERVRAAISEVGRSSGVTASVGAAATIAGTASAAEVISDADEAVYVAKRSGGDQVRTRRAQAAV